MTILIALLCIESITSETSFKYRGTTESVYLHPGDYKFHVYGAQGGSGYNNDEISSSGGKGAYVSATYHCTEKTLLTITVGGKGLSSIDGDCAGGYPNGGRSGADNGIGSDKDGSGSGGGSSKIAIGSNVIVEAGAGSGGACLCNGAPGGEKDRIYCPYEENNRYQSYTTSQKGNKDGNGGQGVSTLNVPGSGGGGGYYGGPSSGDTAAFESTSYKAVACGGSSYINSDFITSFSASSGKQEGDGLVKITPNYICPQNCSDCISSLTCTSCYPSFELIGGQCHLIRTPEPTPQMTPEITPHKTPEITPQMTPETLPPKTPHKTPEITPQSTNSWQAPIKKKLIIKSMF